MGSKSLLLFFLIALSAISNGFAQDTTAKDEPRVVSPATPKKALKANLDAKTAVIVRLEEMVDPGMAAYTKRAIKEAEARNPDVIIFEVNTFGGELMAAFDIVDAITALKIPTVALVNKKAISAGALISLSANKLYMKPSTTIGDCAPVVQGNEGPVMLGEKIQSPLRAKFRNLSQKNGYPELLGQAMVSADLEVVRIQKGDSIQFLERLTYEELTKEEKKGWSAPKTVVKEGELLTLTEMEAEKWGFSSGTVEDMDALVKKLGVTLPEEVKISWAEKLAKILRQITPLLLLIGFGALYMEFQTPGFGLFGIAGILLVSIAFGGQAVVHLTGKLPVILLVLGAVLIMVEVLITPGTMVAGLTGIGLMGASLVLVLKDATLPWQSPDVATGGITQALLYVVGMALAGLIIPLIMTRYVLPYLPGGFSVMQEATLAESKAPVQDEQHVLQKGLVGQVIQELRPAGKVKFVLESQSKGDAPTIKVVEVQSRDRFVDKGKTVKITSVQGNQIWVAEVTAPQAESAAPEQDSETEGGA